MKLWVVSTPFKEVLEGFIQVPKRLLQGDSGNFIQPTILRLALESGETSRSVAVVETFLTLVVGIRPESKCPIVDETHTPKGPSKSLLLLVGRVYSILISAFLFHVR